MTVWAGGGHTDPDRVVAECVNPLAVTRDTWRAVAGDHGARLLEVELICTDQAVHRERVRTARWISRALRCRAGSRSWTVNTNHGIATTWSSTPRSSQPRRRWPRSLTRRGKCQIMFELIDADPT